ncbi:type II secretion system minor pseudopilin GspJ [Sphingopyxis yananensis]|uniref:type II secretion system minor pseudopilin GspJ n=1 Tax=Sphingopyxis yananensis TaxID=2886687 RepID=UPI001D124C2C|nr:type II secretion system minor pseudopilin GspJ [Sphingopyxis yananensis]MCC2601989.1 type II secretion system minor pseudopilin GspJ [Sphingopyxis yananensis]
MTARGNDQGFTLVEMLVALALFAAIAAMGVTLLRSSVNSQESVQKRLSSMGGVNRLRAILAEDLAQALSRRTRDVAGAEVPAFVGTAEDMAFVHGGAGGWEGRSAPDVQRVRYALENGTWTRAVQPMLDGTVMGKGDVFARDIAQATLRYRDGRGGWHDMWPIADGTELPRAVELTLVKNNTPPLRMLFALGPVPIVVPPTGIAGDRP